MGMGIVLKFWKRMGMGMGIATFLSQLHISDLTKNLSISEPRS